jgi:hypothetical protein
MKIRIKHTIGVCGVKLKAGQVFETECVYPSGFVKIALADGQMPIISDGEYEIVGEIHPSVENAIQEIDAAFFSSDTFEDFENLLHIKRFVNRWINQIGKLEDKHFGPHENPCSEIELPGKQITPNGGDAEELLDADPNCKHNVVNAPGGGVKCTKCHGWFCY